MKKAHVKILISVLVSILAFIALGTSTFAWFSLATSVEVDNINISVTSGPGLDISLDEDPNRVYKTRLIGQEFLDKIYELNHSSEFKLYPVTTRDGINYYDSAGSSLNLANNKYVELNIYFKASNVENYDKSVGVFIKNYDDTITYPEGGDVSLIHTNDMYVVSKGVTINPAGVSFTDSNNDAIINTQSVFKKATESIRLSFTDAIDNSVRFFDFSDNPQYGYGYGYSSEASELKGAASFHYAKNEKLYEVPEEWDSVNFPIATKDDLSTFDGQGVASNLNSLVCTLENVTGTTDYIGYTTIRIWLEGYDADCYDFIILDNLLLQLSFSLGLFE